MDDPWAAAGFLDQAPGQKASTTPSSAPPADDAWEAAGFSDHATQAPAAGAVAKKPFGLGDTWPAKLAKSAWDAVTLPSDVYAGKVDPTSEEGIARATKMGMFATPMPPGLRAGEGVAGAAITPKPIEATPAMQAAGTAAEMGAPLPVGIASENPAVRAATAGAKQFPLVGPQITEQTGKAVTAAGERVGGIASELGGGITDRATAGAIMRPGIKDVIEGNNATIDTHFNALRDMLNPQSTAILPRTESVLNGIVKERAAAGAKNPMAGLEDVGNLVNNKASFDGIQRARSDLGNTINFGTANPGYNKGDLKRLYGALTEDMGYVASQTVKPGVKPEAAVAALREANSTAAPLIEFNKQLQQLTGMQRDESLIGSLVNAANTKTGNVQILAKLRQSLPQEQFQQISGVALHELGYKPAINGFSLNQFATKWSTMGDRAKAIMFSPEHRKMLDDVAQLGTFLKDADKYVNTSNTAGAAEMAKLVTGLGAAGAALMSGAVLPIAGLLAGAGGGYVLARSLARPASAAALANWSRAAIAASRGQSPARLASLRLATRNLVNNVPELATAQTSPTPTTSGPRQ